jgi:hypothetical protein
MTYLYKHNLFSLYKYSNIILIYKESNNEVYQKGDYYWVFISELNEWIPGMYDGDSIWMIVGSDEK